jgi:phage-related protein
MHRPRRLKTCPLGLVCRPASSSVCNIRPLDPVTDTLDMRAPDLGNRDRLAFNRINRETRGGTLIVYADPMWPKLQTLALTFSGLKKEIAHDLLTFISAHLGEEIKLLDWEGRQWTGVIMTPNEPITEDSKNRFTATFEFEGVPA